MQSKDQNIHYSDLILKYLSGNASPSEVEELEAWVMDAPENKERFIADKKAWLLSGMRKEQQEVDVEALWKQTAQELFPQAKVVQLQGRRKLTAWLGIAAAAILLLIASFLYFKQAQSPKNIYVQSSEEVKNFALSDGSQITLNQSSTLRFNPTGENKERRVELEGDAFFDVARDTAHPFIIHTQNLEIEVLGTSFYVDSRKEQSEIQVIVESGSVAVRVGEEERVLTADEKAIFDKNTGDFVKVGNEDRNYLALKSKTLVFEETRMEDVAFALSRQFNVAISFKDEALKDCLHDGIYEDMSLRAILKILEAGSGINTRELGARIILEGACEE